MRKHYDFSNAKRNPHAGKFKDGYTVIVEHKDHNEVITVNKSAKIRIDNETIADANAITTVINP